MATEREIRLNHALIRALPPNRVRAEHGSEYAPPFGGHRHVPRKGLTRAERLGSKARRLNLDGLRMLRALLPESIEALGDIIRSRNGAPGIRLEAIRMLHNRLLGPEALSLQLLQQNNYLVRDGGGSPSEPVRSPFDDLPMDKRLEYLREVSQVLLESKALLPAEPEDRSARQTIEIEVQRSGEAAAPGGDEVEEPGQEGGPGSS